MLVSGRKGLLVLFASFVILSLVIPPSHGSSNSKEELDQSRNKTAHPLEVIRVVTLHLISGFHHRILRYLILNYIHPGTDHCHTDQLVLGTRGVILPISY